MQLTRFSDISLRLLLYLASRDRTASVTVTARAASTLFRVPYTHMVKVVHQLARQGFLITSKGKGGGLRLAQPPASTPIGHILRHTEPGHAVVDCFTQPCPLRFECALKHALDDAYEAFFLHLDRFSLADLATMPALQALVQLPSAGPTQSRQTPPNTLEIP